MKKLIFASMIAGILLSSCQQKNTLPVFQTEKTKSPEVHFVRVTAAELFPELDMAMNIHEDIKSTVRYSQIVARAQQKGYTLCTSEDAYHFRDQYQNQPIGEIVSICVGGTESYSICHFHAACGNPDRLTIQKGTLDGVVSGWAQFIFKN